jgi:hypothetical protein
VLETFPTDLTDDEYIEAVLLRMADNLFAAVRDEGRSIRTLSVRVRYNDMGEDQISESLLEPTDLETDVYCLIRTLLRKAWKRRVSVRLVSLKLSNVYRTAIPAELSLLPNSRRRESCARLAGQVDLLRKAHGAGVILRAHDLRLRHPPRDALVKGPVSTGGVRIRLPSIPPKTLTYVPLRGHSHYSFLDSTLSPAALVAQAKHHGLSAVALTDTGNLHGAAELFKPQRMLA